MADAERALCWLRGWVAPSHVSEELSTLAAHIDKRNVRIVKARDQDYHQVPSQDLGEFANTVAISWYKTGPKKCRLFKRRNQETYYCGSLNHDSTSDLKKGVLTTTTDQNKNQLSHLKEINH